VYVVINFTNTSGSTCTLFGYPGVSLVTGPPYKQIGLAAKRSTSTSKKLVTLAAGATANAQLRPYQGDGPEGLPAQPDRAGLPAEHLHRLQQARPDPVHRRRPPRLLTGPLPD
jgi:hypothetical protein